MNKKLVLGFVLENGKKASFSLSKIKDISASEASAYLKDVDFAQTFEFKNQKVEKLKTAEIISITSEKISLE